MMAATSPRPLFRILAVLSLLPAAGGCSVELASLIRRSPPPEVAKALSAPTGNVPSWIRGEPKVAGNICAVGVSEPAYFEIDALENAAKNRRAELARSISVKVQSVMLDVAEAQHESTEEASVQQVAVSVSDAVLEHSEHTEVGERACRKPLRSSSGPFAPRLGSMF